MILPLRHSAERCMLLLHQIKRCLRRDLPSVNTVIIIIILFSLVSEGFSYGTGLDILYRSLFKHSVL